MITHIIPGHGIQVSGGVSGSPYINQYSNNLMVGQLRYNPQTSSIDVYDGNAWLAMTANPTSVSLDMSTIRILSWAEKKMREEEHLKERMSKHPGLKDAYDRFKILDILCSEDEAVSS